jgi:hypothetical protein
MDEDIKILKGAIKTLNRAYSDLVAYSIIAIHLYEEYLLDKATSKELAIGMSDLLKSLPTDFAGIKLKKPRKSPRKPSKAVSGNGSISGPPHKKDEEKGRSDK